MSLRILHLDIETSPMISYTWGTWKQNIAPSQIKSDWYIISWAASWEDEDDVWACMLPFFDEYEKDPKNDKALMLELWDLLDEADIVVAHNGAGFDVPKINTRFLAHGIKPPSPFKVLDTLKAAKQYFKFTSNRLDYIDKFLGFEGKLGHEGMELWLGCLRGDMDCWNRMLDYNAQDVRVLKQVYHKLRPYILNHPHTHRGGSCTVCGSANLVKKGVVYTATSKYQRYVCKDCGKWSRAAISDTTTEERKEQLRNIL